MQASEVSLNFGDKVEVCLCQLTHIAAVGCHCLFQLNVISTELVLRITVMPEQSIYMVVWWQLVILANTVLGERHSREDQLLTKSPDPDVQCKVYVVCSDSKVKSKRHKMRFSVTFVIANQHCMWRNGSKNVILWSNICHRHLEILCALIMCRWYVFLLFSSLERVTVK